MSFYTDGASAPSTDVADKAYSGHKGEEVPVQPDEETVKNLVEEVISASDSQLNRDDKEAIDASNIIGERTRHAKPINGTYRQPDDEEGLPPAEVVAVSAPASASTPVSESTPADIDAVEDKKVVEDGIGDGVDDAPEGAKEVEGTNVTDVENVD